MKIVPVILAGGTGTRLWPISRNALPKQFIAVTSGLTLFQETLLRTAPGEQFHAPVVITNSDYRFYAQRQAAAVGIESTTILEPSRRDSGPALIAAAAYVSRRYGPDTLVLALASDHVVPETDKFCAAVAIAAHAASLGHIVTFGITPDSPRSSYGYIRLGNGLAVKGAYEVASFVEKPDAETARGYMDAGFLWNSGNFLFPADLLISEANTFAPDLAAAAVASLEKATEDIGFIRLDPKSFDAAPSKSIDFAVLEHTRKAAVVRGLFTWSDAGSWEAVHEVSADDGMGNVVQGDVVLIDSANSFVRSDGPLVTAIGVDNISIVVTSDAVLVMPSDRSQDVKTLVSVLKKSRRREVDVHRTVYRPWGFYERVCAGDRFQVKKIVVEPGGKLSLQKHHHRSEHWIVVRGTAAVTLDEREFIVNENESTYIPIGSVHSLANPGRIPLELVEVQTGSYLGEDDIVRLEDIYKRA